MRGALILCLAALVGSPSADHWAYRYVEYAADLEVLQAYDATHYRPDTVLTRAQMAVYVARAFELALWGLGDGRGRQRASGEGAPPLFARRADMTAEGLPVCRAYR